jgi:hypothetical protein
LTQGSFRVLRSLLQDAKIAKVPAGNSVVRIFVPQSFQVPMQKLQVLDGSAIPLRDDALEPDFTVGTVLGQQLVQKDPSFRMVAPGVKSSSKLELGFEI